MNLRKSGFLDFYIPGSRFQFCLVLASVHQFKVYASEQPIQNVNEGGVKEVTREVMG